ncbi:MAG: hypothetical protein LBV49_13260 [Azonexus sp.]|nr:hypothetical protein [Azonexus sp.]
MSHDLTPGGQGASTVLLMLPGAGMRGADYRANGFIAAAHERGFIADVALTDIPAENYLAADFPQQAAAIWASIEHYQTIWLLGISLGAYAALRLMQSYPGRISGAALLAPFLAPRGVVAGVRRMGGLDQWSPGSLACHAADEALFGWLKENFARSAPPVDIYLGWGEQDRYAEAAKLLAARLKPERIFHRQGDHDWPTWKLLWQDMLAAMPINAAAPID